MAAQPVSSIRHRIFAQMPRELRNAAINCALAVVFAVFAAAHVEQLLVQARLSLVLLVAVETVLVVLFLTRRDANETLHSWQAWSTTAAGTLFPLLLRPAPEAEDILVGQLVQSIGVALQVAALLSLNRSMGLLPAHRGVKTSGAYRLVRHPLYAAYAIGLVGYLINNFNIYNAAVVSIGMCFQVIRIRYEEGLLFGYPAYTAFAEKTRWRLIPFLW
jgi:protein-S-isoprenylcysteine O-methyltransferase Ste14